MLDLTYELPLPLALATQFVPPGRGGKKTHLSTLLRWIRDGVKSPAGKIVRLEALRLGGRWVTSQKALQRFAERLTPDSEQGSAATHGKPTRDRRASERADAELERRGL